MTQFLTLPLGKKGFAVVGRSHARLGEFRSSNIAGFDVNAVGRNQFLGGGHSQPGLIGGGFISDP